MERKKVIELLEKERLYQDERWGGPEKDKEKGLGGFLVFIKVYLDDAMMELTADNESSVIDIIAKIMALSSATLESFGNIDVEKWRKQ